MKLTAELLKNERIKKGYTIQDVASYLKLSSKVVTAIEAGDLSSLPPKTFVRGFVKSYADFLKIDSVFILKQFHEEVGPTRPEPNLKPTLANQKTSETKSTSAASTANSTSNPGSGSMSNASLTLSTPPLFSKTNVLTGLVVVGLIFVIVFINSTVEKYQKDLEINPQIQAENKSHNATTPEASPTDTKNILDPLVSTATTPAEMNIPQLNSVNNSIEANLNSAPAAPAETTQNTMQNPAKTVDATANNTPAEAPGKLIEIILEAKKDTQVQYAIGNSTQFKSLDLKTNSYHILKSSSGLKLRADDGSAINLVVNGVSKGSPSSSNKPVQLSF